MKRRKTLYLVRPDQFRNACSIIKNLHFLLQRVSSPSRQENGPYIPVDDREEDSTNVSVHIIPVGREGGGEKEGEKGGETKNLHPNPNDGISSVEKPHVPFPIRRRE